MSEGVNQKDLQTRDHSSFSFSTKRDSIIQQEVSEKPELTKSENEPSYYSSFGRIFS